MRGRDDAVKLFVYQRVDGTYWADFSEKVCARRGRVCDFHEAASRDDFEKLIEREYPHAQERIRSLAERALDEYLSQIKATQPAPPPIERIDPPRPAPVVKKRRWFEFLNLWSLVSG